MTAVRYVVTNPYLLWDLYGYIVEYAAADDEAIAASHGYTDTDDINAAAAASSWADSRARVGLLHLGLLRR